MPLESVEGIIRISEAGALLPVVGTPFAIIATIGRLGQGDLKGAGLNALGVIPFGRFLGKLGKAERVAEEVVDGVNYTKSNLQLGQQVHKAYKAAEHAPELGLFKEFTGVKGVRPDFVDFNRKTIYELKPYNPRGLKSGAKQLKKYRTAFEKQYGGTWKTVLDTY